jgi:ABC-type transport system involved in multi-copper enzyme maturation permease subunit
MLTICRLTVREGLRKKLIYLFLGLGGALLLLLYSRPENIRFDDRPVTDPRLMTQVGLWTSLTFSSLLAVFVAMNAIGSERERGTTHLILVRAVSRRRFWLERWLGVTCLAWLNMAFMLAALTLALTLRCGPPAVWIVLPAAFVLPLAVACVTALVTAVNTPLSAALSGFAGLIVVLMGLSRGALELAAAGAAGFLSRMLAGLACLVAPPLDDVVPLALRIGGGQPVDLWLLHHCTVYVFVCVSLGLACFHGQEL